MSILVMQSSWWGRESSLLLLNLSSWCLVMVDWLFLVVTWGCLQFVVVVFPDHTHYFGHSCNTLKLVLGLFNLQWLAKFIITEPWHKISNNVVCATRKASDQPAHTRSLIRASASRMNILECLATDWNHLEFLSLQRGCTGSSESTHVKMPHCWKSHVVAQLSIIITHSMEVCHA